MSSRELILYDHPVSSYAQKVRIFLREKGIPFKAVLPEALKTGQPDSDFSNANPRLEVPTLIDDDLSVFDSTIIIEYLEDKYPTPALLPQAQAQAQTTATAATAALRAQARMIEEICDTHYEAVNWGYSEIEHLGRADDNGQLKQTLKAEATQQTRALQTWLEDRLGDKSYFNGDQFGWADICVAPIVNRSKYYGIGPAKDSRLETWLGRIQERESVRQTFAEFDVGVVQLKGLKDIFLSGTRKREYRDHRLEWMIKSGGIDIVMEGLKRNNVRFSWPDPDPGLHLHS